MNDTRPIRDTEPVDIQMARATIALTEARTKAVKALEFVLSTLGLAMVVGGIWAIVAAVV